jgi:hypothetical protein
MAFIRIPAGAQEIVNVAGPSGETVARIYRIGRQHYIKRKEWKESKKITESEYETFEKIGFLNKKGNRSRRF